MSCQPAAAMQWLTPHTKPTARGVYPTRLLGFWPGYSYWSGTRWGLEGETPEQAMQGYSAPWADQRKPWRNTPVTPGRPSQPDDIGVSNAA